MVGYSYELKITRERVAVLIGKNGEVKKSIESDTNTQIKVDSLEGDIFIYGEDALGLYTAREVIRAIGRGFNPEIAKYAGMRLSIVRFLALWTGIAKYWL